VFDDGTDAVGESSLIYFEENQEDLDSTFSFEFILCSGLKEQRETLLMKL